MSVTIFRGVPGSGKSTRVSKLFAGSLVARPVWPFETARIMAWGETPRTVTLEGEASAAVFSTDDYFCDPDFRFEFDINKLAEGHNTCLREFTTFVRQADKAFPIVVDNTNVTIAEVAPFVAVAQAFGHTAKIITIICDPVVAFERNTHDVPFKTIFQRDRRLRDETALFPPYWSHDIVVAQ